MGRLFQGSEFVRPSIPGLRARRFTPGYHITGFQPGGACSQVVIQGSSRLIKVNQSWARGEFSNQQTKTIKLGKGARWMVWVASFRSPFRFRLLRAGTSRAPAEVVWLVWRCRQLSARSRLIKVNLG